MNFLYLTKSGRNVQILAYDDVTNQARNFYEDSSNVELIYNLYNNRVTLNIKGNFNFTTDDIINNDVLYIDSGSGQILIKDNGNFNAQYSLLFLSGGSGPITTPNLQAVLNQGNSGDSSGGTNELVISDNAGGYTIDMQGYGAIIENTFNDGGNLYRATTTPLNYHLIDFVNNAEITIDSQALKVEVSDNLKNSVGIYSDHITSHDNHSGTNYVVSFPANSQQNVSFPDDSGTLQIKSYFKKIIFTLTFDNNTNSIVTNILFSDGLTFLSKYQNFAGNYNFVFNEIYNNDKQIIFCNIQEDPFGLAYLYDCNILSFNKITTSSNFGFSIDSFDFNTKIHRDLLQSVIYNIEVTILN